MKRGTIFALIICICLLSVLMACAEHETTPAPTPTPKPTPTPTPEPSAAKPIELKLAFHHPPQSFPPNGAFGPWAQQIEEESGGRVKITLYPGATLVKMHDEYDAVESGLVDMVGYVPDITPGRFPRCEIAVLPKLFPSGEVAGRVLNELFEKYAVDTELKGVKLLWVLGLPPMQLHSTKPVQKLEDFKGMKMRIEGKVEGWTVEELGATGVTMDTLEIYTSLERGLVEGIFFLWEGVLAFGFNEITKYRTECGMFTRGFPTVMNWDTWNSLPADIQEIFNKHSGPEMSAQIGAAFDGANAGAMGAVMGYDKEVGNPGIYILPDDEDARWKAAVAPVIDTWVNEKEAEGVPAKAMLDDAIRLIKQYSK